MFFFQLSAHIKKCLSYHSRSMKWPCLSTFHNDCCIVQVYLKSLDYNSEVLIIIYPQGLRMATCIFFTQRVLQNHLDNIAHRAVLCPWINSS